MWPSDGALCLDALAECDVAKAVVVVGHGAERVTKKLQEEAGDLDLDFVEQHVQRGTGDATSVGLTAFTDDDDDGDVIVLPGDTPLLRASTIASLVREHRLTEAACTILTARSDDATGYGRIVRGKDDRVVRVVEERDATDEERAITEWNTSIYCFRRSVLAPALRRVTPDNDQGEYYLTDVVEVLHDAGYSIVPILAPDDVEPHGINDRRQLARAESELRRRINDAWLGAGVTMVDPDRTYIDTTVRLAPDVTIFPGTLLQGTTVVGEGVELGPDTRLVDCTVGDGPSSSARWGVTPTSARRDRGALRSSRTGAHIAPGSANRLVLHCNCGGVRKLTKGAARDGAGHQEDVADLRRPLPPGAV